MENVERLAGGSFPGEVPGSGQPLLPELQAQLRIMVPLTLQAQRQGRPVPSTEEVRNCYA
jgi:hypothetical protein